MNIGFIGLGLMGAGMAANLQKAGHHLVVNDTRREAADRFVAGGADWAASPTQLAEAVDLVFTSLPGPAEVEAVALGINGLLAGMRPGMAWFDLSTNSVTLIRRLHGIFAESGISLLDAPVSGGAAGAVSGNLAIWVGGDQAAFDKFKPVLDDFSNQARHIGPIGAGLIVKLVHNCASATISVALAEIFSVGVKAGLEPLALLDALRQGGIARMRVFDPLSSNFLTSTFEPVNFALQLLQKDVALAVDLGSQVNAPMRMAEVTLENLTEAVDRGWGKLDRGRVMALQVERAGLPPLKENAEAVKAILARG